MKKDENIKRMKQFLILLWKILNESNRKLNKFGLMKKENFTIN